MAHKVSITAKSSKESKKSRVSSKPRLVEKLSSKIKSQLQKLQKFSKIQKFQKFIKKITRQPAKLYLAWSKSRYYSLTVKLFSGLAVLLGLFLILMPVFPQLPYYFAQLRGEQIYEPHKSYFDFRDGSDGDSSAGNNDSIDQNMIMIPVVGIEAPVVEGGTEDALSRGAWHRPGTGTPDEGGNTVITGHRFRYLPPNNLTFYHLDKVEIGDQIIVYWEGIEYDYIASEIFIVEPSRVDVEADTANPRLTLYTCTPLWTAEKRLVVVAIPQDPESGTGDVQLEDISE